MNEEKKQKKCKKEENNKKSKTIRTQHLNMKTIILT